MLLSEEWRLVVGWPYEVSDLGRVRRIGGKPLRPGPHPRGDYSVVILCNRGKQAARCVHRLVAEAFIGPRPPGREVNHIDGDQTNDRPGNLEYVTHRENCLHAARTGLTPQGERHVNAKLRAEQVREIRQLRRDGARSVDLAERFGVDPTTICDVVIGRTWKGVV